MTDCALAAPVPTAPTTTSTRVVIARRRERRTRPVGVPRWAWLLGVSVVPLAHDEAEGPQTWVLSAGAGTTHVMGLLRDDAEDTDTRGSRA